MRVLVVGGGAREHALCLALAADPAVTALVCAPGNAGTAMVAEQRPVAAGDPAAVAALAGDVRADLVVIGPEVPLVAGCGRRRAGGRDRLLRPERRGGPDRGLEGVRQGRDGGGRGADGGVAGPARRRTRPRRRWTRFGPPYVVKDDGLAAGKGVLVTADRAAALGPRRGLRHRW